MLMPRSEVCFSGQQQVCRTAAVRLHQAADRQPRDGDGLPAAGREHRQQLQRQVRVGRSWGEEQPTPAAVQQVRPSQHNFLMKTFPSIFV